MTFRPATDADRDAWQGLLARLPSGDFLHDWAWAAVAAFDGQPQSRYLLEENGEVVAVAAAQVRPIGWGRTFWYVPHGPVLDFAHADAASRLEAVVDGLVAAARDGKAVSLRLEPRIPADGPEVALFDHLAPRVPQRLQVGQTRIVDLVDDDDALLSGFDADTRNAVRRSAREGVTVTWITDPADHAAIDRLHALVRETQQRAGFRLPPRDRYLTAWEGLAAAGRAALAEARVSSDPPGVGDVLASGMLVVEGGQSFYLFAGSRRDAASAHRFASTAVQWAMMREARARGARRHDLWGVAPVGAGSDHPWYGVGLFKKGFGGHEVTWAGSWEVAVDPLAHRLRGIAGRFRGGARVGQP